MRLEIRRISGNIHKDQIYRRDEIDGRGSYVLDPNGIKIVDDAALGKPPWTTFEFKFREDPKITQRIREENAVEIKSGISNHLKASPAPKSSRGKSLINDTKWATQQSLILMAQPSNSNCNVDQPNISEDDSNHERQISSSNTKFEAEGFSNLGGFGADHDITQRKR